MTEQHHCFPEHIVLASASPRRKELLSALGLCFTVHPSEVDETPLNNEPPDEHVQRLALAKAQEVSAKFPGRWVLGADTIVVIDGKMLGKPTDTIEARAMLATLADRTHDVYTGYAIVNSMTPEQQRIRFVKSSVYIRKLAQDEIEAYVGTGEPMDKAGSYAVQGIGSALVERIYGSYTNVVGLPLCEVARDFKELGIFNFLEAGLKS
jgi:septum formation protein